MIELTIKVSDAERSLVEKTLLMEPFTLDAEDETLKPLITGAIERFGFKPEDVVIKARLTV